MPMETLRFEGSKLNCFPRDQSSSDLLYSRKFMKPRCNSGCRSTFAGNKVTLWSHRFFNFARSKILAGNGFIVSCHVTSKSPMRVHAVGKNFQLKNKNYCFIFPIAFEKNNSWKISVPNWVYYGGFQNSHLRHMLPRLPLVQGNHNNASGIPKRLKDLSMTCDDSQSFILFFIILSSSLPV